MEKVSRATVDKERERGDEAMVRGRIRSNIIGQA